jgi:hypothetical protein
MSETSGRHHYSCHVDSRKLAWNCELFDSFLEAQRHLEAYRFLSYGNFVGKIVSFSPVWPGFVRRQLLQFELVIPITTKSN